MKLNQISIALLFTTALAACGGSSESVDAAQTEVVAVNPPPTQPTVQPVTFSQKPTTISQDAYAQFAFAAPNAQGYQCQLDNGSVRECSSPYLVYPLDAGAHQLSVRAVGSNSAISDVVVSDWTVSSIFPTTTSVTAHPDLTPTQVQPQQAAAQSWRGIFRINCDFAHSSYNDPIVFPGQANAAHLHRFYGNTLIDHNSDLTSLFTTGESSCQGNTLNRSAYWIPALLAPAYHPETAARLIDEQGEPAWKVVPAVVGNDEEAHEIFYYSAGVDNLESIQPIPLGLKMIAGNSMGQPGNEQDTSIVRWHCQSWQSDDASNPRWSTSIPECLAPDRLRMDIFFPSCWNGVDLDSFDHKSHMAYPVNNGNPNGTACPASHPVPIIRVSFHYAFGVKPEVYDPHSKSSRGWRFASDMYEVSTTSPGGMSLHGDWLNAWQPQALQAILDGCIKQRLDCHDGNLANGFRLTGTRPGSQTEPAIINKGLGH